MHQTEAPKKIELMNSHDAEVLEKNTSSNNDCENKKTEENEQLNEE